MKKLLISTPLFVILCFLLACCTPPTPDTTALEENIREAFDSSQGTFALAFFDLDTENALLINARESFHAASTMKTPVMIEVYRQAAAGRFDLGDSLLIKNEFYSIVDSSYYQLNPEVDSEQALYEAIGSKRSIRDLVYDMIISSSNLATNIIIDQVDARRVTNTMCELGAEQIEVLRGVEDLKAFEQGLSNSTTAQDLLLIYTKLARGEIVSASACAEMIDILKDQRFNEIIPAQLPQTVEVAHKTGSITGVHHDSGIVYLPDGRRYVLVLLSKEMSDFDAGTKMLASVSKLVYEYMTSSIAEF